MVSQYPYKLFVFETTGDYQDANGDWRSGISSWVFISNCRDETNSKASQINLSDETAYVYDSLIQLPKSCPKVEVNLLAEIRDLQGNLRVKGTVKRFSRDQLHTRLWL
jgi:hypothetical protein